ncbi:MAG TPA: hypothetical protein VL335_00430 [Candidatus Paceibacterota bacterium]|nr:hypothetical protein [Candidatus Paceibacterota bacterium]
METPEQDPSIENNSQSFEQQAEAETIARLREIIVKKMSGTNLLPTHEKITAFVKKLDEKYGRDVVKETKLFHLFTNPRKSTFDFASTEHPLDLPQGEIGKFIDEEL